MRRPRRARAERERGFALVAVLLVLALLGVVGGEFAYSMRVEATAVRAYKDMIIGGHLAEAGVAQAVREIAADYAFVAACKSGLTFYGRDSKPLVPPPHEKVPLGAGQFTYRISDEEGRLNINVAPPERTDRLLQQLGLEKIERDRIVDSILDWVDPNEEHRLNGAESEDTYLKLPVPYRARNGIMESINELLQVKGVTRAIFEGADGKRGLQELVTVRTQGAVNINTAPPAVLFALGLSAAEISDIEQARCDAPYPVVPGRYGGRGFVATSRTFRVEAEGLVDGRVSARVTAILRKQGDGNAAAIGVVDWSGIR